jgi:hypothetical protein
VPGDPASVADWSADEGGEVGGDAGEGWSGMVDFQETTPIMSDEMLKVA